MRPATLYSLALVRAHRGQVQQARELASEALALCDSTGNVPVRSQVLSVLGFVALSLDDHQAAHSHLGRLAEATAAFGLGEPSVVKFLPDEIEALAALGQVDLARSLTRSAGDAGEVARAPMGAGDERAMPCSPRRRGRRPRRRPDSLRAGALAA